MKRRYDWRNTIGGTGHSRMIPLRGAFDEPQGDHAYHEQSLRVDAGGHREDKH
jgi:hypothetical protein